MKSNVRPWVKIQSAGWVKFQSARTVLSDKGFIAIDEIGRVLGGVKSAMDLTTNIAKAGGSFLVVAQHEDQVKSFSDISVPFVMRMHLERR